MRTGELPTAAEKACPNCASEAIAWISTSSHADSPAEPRIVSQQFECRRCKVVFIYTGPE
jgi:hypothetical protein